MSPGKFNFNTGGFVERPEIERALEDALIGRRERAIVLEGAPGSGKTSLVNWFASRHSNAFAAGITGISGRLFDPADPAVLTSHIAIEGQALHIFDGLDEVRPPREAIYAALLEGLARNPAAQLLITMRPGAIDLPLPHLDIKPMTIFETGMLFRRIVMSAEPPPVEALEWPNGIRLSRGCWRKRCEMEAATLTFCSNSGRFISPD